MLDSFHAYNIGLLSSRASEPLFAPCTPAGVMLLLESTGIDINGKHAVVLGRSDIVGSPVAALLRRKNATVTQCHSQTRDLEQIVKQADIVVAAIGQPRFVQGSWLKPGAVVIDVGTNYIDDPTRKSGSRLVGDVDFDSAREVASFITPVPGGVGPMTVAMLMENTVLSAQRLFEKSQQRLVKPLKLVCKENVPSDIEIAKSQNPKPIDVLAAEIGIPGQDLEMYGRSEFSLPGWLYRASFHADEPSAPLQTRPRSSSRCSTRSRTVATASTLSSPVSRRLLSEVSFRTRASRFSGRSEPIC